MQDWVRPLEVIAPSDADLFGRKAATLGNLLRAGFPVPAGFGVSNEAFAAHAERAVGARWWESPPGEDSATKLRDLELDSLLVEQVLSSYEKLANSPIVAVRSSASVEDALGFSGAGVQESVIGVSGARELLGAIRRVWASAWSAKALAYLSSIRSVDDTAPKSAVVVQLMVRSDVAGVMFTVNPIGSDADELVINAAFGLGEPLCNGQLSPDTFVVDRRDLSIARRSVKSKPFMVEFKGTSKCRVALDAEHAQAPSLSDEQILQIAELGLRIERRLGRPSDIEWALSEGRLSVLQARPITRRSTTGQVATEIFPGRSDDVWTNANVGEALPGVATTLTWSIASRYSERGFTRAFTALGCDVPDGATLVGRFHGRIYLNLTQFVEVASQLPLLRPQTLAELGGARWPKGFEPKRKRLDVLGGVRFIRKLPRALARLLSQNVAVEREVETIEVRVAAMRRRLDLKDLRSATNAQLSRELVVIDELLEATGDAMLTCGSNALGSFLLVRFLLERWLGARAKGVEHELISGAAELESAKPGIALWNMAEAIKEDPTAARILLDTDLDKLTVSSFPKGSSIRRDLESFQAAYGYRAVREAELMTPRWREEPNLIFATLREHLRSGRPPPGRALESPHAARRRAVTSADAALGRSFRGVVVRRLVGVARRYSRLRERLRARVTQVLGLYRSVALEVSRRLGSDDIAFFLTIEEVHQLLGGSDSRATSLEKGARSSTEPLFAAWGLGPSVATRRQEYERFLGLPEPPPTFVGKPPPQSDEVIPPHLEGRELEGVAASPGQATGNARILRDVQHAGELKAGEILVVSCADVGWSPLFLLAGAVVTERGGVLSHASVVAREYGVPAVVGVHGATKSISNGQKLIVDGDRGCVVICVNS